MLGWVAKKLLTEPVDLYQKELDLHLSRYTKKNKYLLHWLRNQMLKLVERKAKTLKHMFHLLCLNCPSPKKVTSYVILSAHPSTLICYLNGHMFGIYVYQCSIYQFRNIDIEVAKIYKH